VSPRPFGYRTTVTLTVLPAAAAAAAAAVGRIVGFHPEGEPGRVFPLERCEIAREELHALWLALRPALESLPPGDDVRLKLRVAVEGALHVVVDGGEGAWHTPQPLARAVEAAGLTASLWWHPGGGAVRHMAGRGADPGAVSFEQVNAEVAALLRSAVLDAVPASAARVLDLYAGAGETALAVAAAGRQVVMVEVDRAAVARAERRARGAGLSVSCIAGRVEDHIAKLLPADVVIANPPRTGLAEAVASRLAAHVSPLTSHSSRLVYVSCDPATLARDLRRLGATADHLKVLAFDMFPQTSHVETLAVLEGGG